MKWRRAGGKERVGSAWGCLDTAVGSVRKSCSTTHPITGEERAIWRCGSVDTRPVCCAARGRPCGRPVGAGRSDLAVCSAGSLPPPPPPPPQALTPGCVESGAVTLFIAARRRPGQARLSPGRRERSVDHATPPPEPWGTHNSTRPAPLRRGARASPRDSGGDSLQTAASRTDRPPSTAPVPVCRAMYAAVDAAPLLSVGAGCGQLLCLLLAAGRWTYWVGVTRTSCLVLIATVIATMTGSSNTPLLLPR